MIITFIPDIDEFCSFYIKDITGFYCVKDLYKIYLYIGHRTVISQYNFSYSYEHAIKEIETRLNGEVKCDVALSCNRLKIK